MTNNIDRADEERTATDLANLLIWFASQFQRWGTARTPSLNEYHLNYSQVSILYLVRYGITTPGALARTLRITPRAVTTHVDVLCEKGLLQRRADPHDRRLVRLDLTSEGRAVSLDVEQRALVPLVERIDALSTPDREALERSIDIFRDFFRDLNETPE